MSIIESPTQRSYVDVQSRYTPELIERTQGWLPLMNRIILLEDYLGDFEKDPQNNVLGKRVIELTEDVIYFQELHDLGLTGIVD